MPRPPCCRRIDGKPVAFAFKPTGTPACELEEVVLALDEFEAIRLADYNGLYQEQAAEKMAVSRPTFGRIIEAAHKKIAEALVLGKLLKIEGSSACQGGQTPCPKCHGMKRADHPMPRK